MNFKTTAVLLVIVLLLIGGLLLVVMNDDAPTAGGSVLAPLAGLKASDIDVVEIVRSEPEEKFVFARTGPETWELRDGNAGKLDLAAVNRTIEALLKLKAIDSPERTSDPAKHGLDKPGLKATLKSKQSSATLHIGDTTAGGTKAVTFVATADRPKVPLAVKRSDIADIFALNATDGSANKLAKPLSEYRLKRLLGVNMMDVAMNAKTIMATQGGKELKLARVGSEWKFDVPAGYGLADLAGDAGPSDAITGVRPLASAFTTFSATAASDFIDKPGPLEQYGLDAANKEMMRVEVVPESGPPDVLLIGKPVPNSAPPKNYAMVPGEPVVVTILGDRVAALAKTIADPKKMQDRTILKETDAAKIDAVSIDAGGSKAIIRKDGTTWSVYGGAEIAPAGPALRNFLQTLAQPKVAIDVLSSPVDAMFGPGDVKSEVKLYTGTSSETLTKYPAIPALKAESMMTLLFGKVDGEKAYLRRTLPNGVKNDFIIPASLATLAAKKRGEYYELSFPKFPTNLAKTLIFNRGGEVFEIERGATEPDFPLGKWTFAKPERLKGQIADTETVLHLIGNVANLSAASVASEKPNDTEIGIMGLEPPRLGVTVKLNDGSERFYRFGNETPDKAYVYFKDPAKATTYTVPRVTIDGFLNDELRDRTPYRFDTKEVKSITLKGWKTKPIHDVVLVRDGDGWTVKGSPNVPANPVTLMNLLNHFKAPKPLAVVGGETPEHGFDASKGGDPLEVTFLDEKGPIVSLTLGNDTDGGNSLFAWNSKTKDVMKLPSGMFRPFKAGPEAFQK